MAKNQTRKKRILKHFGNVSMAIIALILTSSPSLVIDSNETAGQVTRAEDSEKVTKETNDATLKLTKSKPAMTVTTDIVCLACIPVTVAAASSGLCRACGILIVKTFGWFMVKIFMGFWS